MTYEEILADVSGVFRKYSKMSSTLTPEEAVEEIRKIVNQEVSEE